jgi:hypothetical protein
MDSEFRQHITRIKPLILAKDFEAPLNQTSDVYFPDFLNNSLDKYIAFYKSQLVAQVDKQVPFATGEKNIVISKIILFSNEIRKTVDLFFKGKVFEATDTFNKSLDSILFNEISAISTIPANANFYRARVNGEKHLTKADLFHVKFELRHIVSTNRYSIPGFPALYLGDTTYVCWDEFNRHKLRDLWFARITNTRVLKIIQIQRIEDFLKELNSINQDLQLTFLLRYLITFPLTIACSVKVKNPTGNFKPEYIIPQLLLQYISRNDKIDGVKFLSTKVDYSKLHNVDAYNYVFPVKTIAKNGFCSVLSDIFHSTEPTSLELEEIIYNPTIHPTFIGDGTISDTRQIELVEGQKSYYSTTSFGKIETSLKSRKVGHV